MKPECFVFQCRRCSFRTREQFSVLWHFASDECPAGRVLDVRKVET